MGCEVELAKIYMLNAPIDILLERSGALQGVGERVDELLPLDSREKKAKANKHAKWAINVCLLRPSRSR